MQWVCYHAQHWHRNDVRRKLEGEMGRVSHFYFSGIPADPVYQIGQKQTSEDCHDIRNTTMQWDSSYDCRRARQTAY